jgi:hypothetical protein
MTSSHLVTFISFGDRRLFSGVGRALRVLGRIDSEDRDRDRMTLK